MESSIREFAQGIVDGRILEEGSNGHGSKSGTQHREKVVGASSEFHDEDDTGNWRAHDRAEKGSHTHQREFPGLQAISVEPTAPEDAEEEAGLEPMVSKGAKSPPGVRAA